MQIHALPTSLDLYIKKLAFSSSVTAQQGEQWIVAEIKQHIPAVPTNVLTYITEPNHFSKKVAEKQLQALSTNTVKGKSRRFFDNEILARNKNPLTWWKENQSQRSGELHPLAFKLRA